MTFPLATSFVQDPDFINVCYIVAFTLFILGIRQLTHPRTARRGNVVAAVGMAIAVIATLLKTEVGDYGLIALWAAVGTIVGVPAARAVKMTAMPQMVALFNGVGGGAVALISFVEYREALEHGGNPPLETLIPILFAAIIGSISFWGSNVAFGKLQELIPGRPIQLPGQQYVNILLGLLVVGSAVAIAAGVESEALFLAILVGAAILGNMVVLPIGGADMPVVISLLNAFTGLSAAAAGMVLDNTALIVGGMIVGASGTILTNLMAEAMNRSIMNVVVGGFGGVAVASGGEGAEDRPIQSTTAADVAIQLSYAQKVVFVPGYGMAVAQAQHGVRELASELEKRGIEVAYAIHPVAGRMPGHMNVLLAEADVPVRPAQGDGRDQPRVPDDRRVARDRGERRHEPRRARERELADLRHADPRRRRVGDGDRPEALDEPRLRRHRERALLRPQDAHALRRCEGLDRRRPDRGQGALAPRLKPARAGSNDSA